MVKSFRIVTRDENLRSFGAVYEHTLENLRECIYYYVYNSVADVFAFSISCRDRELRLRTLPNPIALVAVSKGMQVVEPVSNNI